MDEPPLTLGRGRRYPRRLQRGAGHVLDAARNARQWIADLERKERERSGISTLKVGYNKVFGYYIEVTQLAAAPRAGRLHSQADARRTASATSRPN